MEKLWIMFIGFVGYLCWFVGDLEIIGMILLVGVLWLGLAWFIFDGKYEKGD